MNAVANADALDLAETLCVRLCHDMAGPVQALSNIAELLEAERAPGAELCELLRKASGGLAAMLKLRRRAWGGGIDGPMDRAALAALADGAGGPRVRYDLTALPEGRAVGASLARVLLNALLLAAESLPRGGTVRLLAETGPAAIPASAELGALLVVPVGPQSGWPAGFTAALRLDAEAAAAAMAEAGPRAFAARATLAIAATHGVVLSFHPPAPGTNEAPGLRLLAPG
ncbi:MAG: hypothetical protein IT557_13340 [Alphaproteobacteria bacterium]|nr:hypothetical protein [Alphaproteobacteria bacterium]